MRKSDVWSELTRLEMHASHEWMGAGDGWQGCPVVRDIRSDLTSTVEGPTNLRSMGSRRRHLRDA